MLIFQTKLTFSNQGDALSVDDLELHRVFPIYGAFSIVMSQMQRRSTIDMRALNSSSGSLDLGKGGPGTSGAYQMKYDCSNLTGALSQVSVLRLRQPKVFLQEMDLETITERSPWQNRTYSMSEMRMRNLESL